MRSSAYISFTVVKINQEVKEEALLFLPAARCELTLHLLKTKNPAWETTEGQKTQPMWNRLISPNSPKAKQRCAWDSPTLECLVPLPRSGVCLWKVSVQLWRQVEKSGARARFRQVEPPKSNCLHPRRVENHSGRGMKYAPHVCTYSASLSQGGGRALTEQECWGRGGTL